jgi:hypothetical protein
VSSVIDHAFLCTSPGGPAAETLRAFGLTEGSPNRHPGQGTACRRFFFQNAMLELLWMDDAVEARSTATRDTRLWDRFHDPGTVCPFGIILRPAPDTHPQCPFPAWLYRPPAMPELALHVAGGTGMDEPMWCYLAGGRPPAQAPPERRQPLQHAAGFRELTGLRLVSPALAEGSTTLAMARLGIISWQPGDDYGLELEFDGGAHGERADFRPSLPLTFRW